MNKRNIIALLLGMTSSLFVCYAAQQETNSFWSYCSGIFFLLTALFSILERNHLKLVTIEGLSKGEEGVAYKKRMIKRMVIFVCGLFIGAFISSILL